MPDRTHPAPPDILALRAEIDALDDAMHDLLMRRAGVVATLAASRAKGQGPALRPGREAVILRRLLARHAGPLPRAALVRLWRELLAATTTMQGTLSIAACLDGPEMEVLRQHFGLTAPIRPMADTPAVLAVMAAGEASLAALPWPDAGDGGGAGRWWTWLDSSRAFVTASLPFFGPATRPVMVLSPLPPDPSGDDRTLFRLPASGAAAALQAAGFAPLSIRFAEGLALAELPGFWMNEPRLRGIGTPLGAFAAPLPA